MADRERPVDHTRTDGDPNGSRRTDLDFPDPGGSRSS